MSDSFFLFPNRERHQSNIVGLGGTLVESMTVSLRVAGSNPAQAQRKYLSKPSLAVAYGVSARSSNTVSVLQSGAPLSSSELEEAL